MSFIHTSDWQIGMPFKYMKENARLFMDADRLAVADSIGGVVRNSAGRIEFVLICGDLFDSSLIGKSLIQKTLRKIGAISAPVFVMAGNHEWKGSYQNILESEVFKASKPENLIVLENGINVVNDRYEILAVPTRGTHGFTNPLESLPADLKKSSRKRILALHAQIDAVIDFGEHADEVGGAKVKLVDIVSLLDSGLVDYVALGDRHSTTDVENQSRSLEARSNGRIFYSGAPEPTRFTEVNQRNILEVDLDGDGCAVSVIEIGKWHFASVGSPTSPINLHSREELDEFLETWQKREDLRTAVKVFAQKYYSTTDELYREARFEAFDQEDFAYFRESDRSEFTPKNEFSLGDENPFQLNGYMLDVYKSLQARAGNDDEVALEAIGLIARLAAKV